MLNKLNMYRNIEQVLESNRTIWEQIPGMVKHVEAFNGLLENMQQLVFEKLRSTKSVTEEKARAFELLGQEAVKLRGALLSLAMEKGDEQMISEIPQGKSPIKYGAYAKRLQIVNQLLLTAEKHIEGLQSHGVDQADIDSLREQWNKTKELDVAPSTARRIQKVIREQVDRMMTEIDQILNQGMDSIALLLKSDHPEFYDNWETARIIIDRRSRRSTDDPLEEFLQEVEEEASSLVDNQEDDGNPSMQDPPEEEDLS